MCTAIDFADNINNQIKEAKKYYNKLKIDLKSFEYAQLDILHKIENLDKFDLYKGWELTKSLQKIRQERRRVKNELGTMELLVGQINKLEIKKEEISLQNKRFKNQVKKKENSYRIRTFCATGDVVNKVDYFIKDINENRNLNISMNNKKQNEDDKGVYCISSKIPKIKGSTIKMNFKDSQQRNHIINKISFMYEDFRINEDDSYIELINRRK